MYGVARDVHYRYLEGRIVPLESKRLLFFIPNQIGVSGSLLLQLPLMFVKSVGLCHTLVQKGSAFASVALVIHYGVVGVRTIYRGIPADIADVFLLAIRFLAVV